MTKITEHELTKLAAHKIRDAKTNKIKDRITDEAIEGFVARRLPSGKVTFGYQYTDKTSAERRWIGIGLHGAVTADEARAAAKRAAGKVAAGEDPAAEEKRAKLEAENTVNHVLNEWIEKYVNGEAKLRTATAIEQALAHHVRPAIGGKVIYHLTRKEIIDLKEGIAKTAPRQAGNVLAMLRKAFNWWQLRDEEFRTPIVPGMAPKQATRDRVLTNEEVADIWRALDEIEHVPGTFAAFVKVLFLTACRRCEVSDMHTREIERTSNVTAIGGAKVPAWTIPAERYKTKIPHLVPLIPAIKKLLPARKDGFVFGCASHRHDQAAGEKPFAGFQKPKDELDAAIARIRRRQGRPPMPAWTYHDLRRTARTMLAELGVSDAVGEAVLGHVKGGVKGIYNRYQYYPQKVEALTALAAHVENIVKARAPAPAAKLRAVAR